MSLNTSSNAKASAFDANASSEEELLASDEEYNRLENVACYTSYCRLLLRVKLAAMDKPSMPRSRCRRVRAVVALDAADHRHVNPLTIDDVHSLI